MAFATRFSNAQTLKLIQAGYYLLSAHSTHLLLVVCWFANRMVDAWNLESIHWCVWKHANTKLAMNAQR